MINSVCIVGCGWFGLPLAKALEARGVKVYGSKRVQSEVLSLKEQGINGFRLDLDNDTQLIQDKAEIAEALAADCIVINIPPGLRKAPQAYLQRLTKLKQLMVANRYQKLIFVSTTGVYPQADKILAEADACAHSEISEKLLQAEAMFAELENSIIVRFAGLVGPKRHPGRFLAGKKDLSSASGAVNLVHLNDCILAVSALLFNRVSSDVYNVCAPVHPTRQAFYTYAAKALGFSEPQFLDDGLITESKAEGSINKVAKVSGKQISSERLCSELDFEFQFSDPIDMLLAC
ncbi:MULTISPECIES: SDR family oxidoreductase [unclassified Shewanella]|uniref:SDR family oxidoreductase n=1 Tax=unclassified Shewanella TaxID=196818 RepID=UPI001BBD13F7|nr:MULTISPECIES: SDR family oxidoreductase [unclassified Shewanella]GIU08783.1 NAD(P)-dependent oxidoreductase [Shewanella sp. MBTL60-112-B1]GIU40763.1 NAD(P)-dependent oxidoreductase [Shewanella sp. MBTL60-112-B2]